MSGRRRPAALVAAVVSACVLALTAAGPALADHTQISIFQDDQHLLYSPPREVALTVLALKLLGVDEIRATVEWAYVAPRPDSRRRPRHFDASNPAAYPRANWARYDLLVRLAKLFHITVLFNVTGPGPLWAMARHPLDARAANHWYPSARDFGQFVHALGVRYDGHYRGLPAVRHFSIWNEPNQPGWLAPQSLRVHGRWVAVSPRLYRSYMDAGYSALVQSGHANDQILIGELAPEGDTLPGSYASITPMPFLRDLYCVNGAYQPLRGAAAAALGCPTRPAPRRFVADNRGLFDYSGFAIHPYYFFHAPNVSAPDPNFVPLADIDRLQSGIDRTLAAWGVRRRPPIYITEYGYQTDPPDPYVNVTPAQQAVYLNEADYMAYNDPRVRSVAQFLLYDSPPDRHYRPDQFDYWAYSFQTGLEYTDGRPKPALAAYRMPLWIPHPRFAPGGQVLVWGQVRPAQTPTATALVQWRSPGAAWATLATVTARAPGHYFTVRLRPPASGQIRIAWQATPQAVLYSRSQAVSAGG